MPFAIDSPGKKQLKQPVATDNHPIGTGNGRREPPSSSSRRFSSDVMASSMPRRQSHQRSAMDPRKRWNNDHPPQPQHRQQQQQGDDNEREEGEVRSSSYPQQQQQQRQQQQRHSQSQQQQQQQQQKANHGHPKFRHRFEPPPQASSPALPPAESAPPPTTSTSSSTTTTLPQDFHERFKPPPSYPPPPQSHSHSHPPPSSYPPPVQQQQQSSSSAAPASSYRQSQQPSPKIINNDNTHNNSTSEYFVPLSKGATQKPPPQKPPPPHQSQPPLPSTPASLQGQLQGHGHSSSGGSLKSRWRNAAAADQREAEQRTRNHGDYTAHTSTSHPNHHPSTPSSSMPPPPSGGSGGYNTPSAAASSASDKQKQPPPLQSPSVQSFGKIDYEAKMPPPAPAQAPASIPPTSSNMPPPNTPTPQSLNAPVPPMVGAPPNFAHPPPTPPNFPSPPPVIINNQPVTLAVSNRSNNSHYPEQQQRRQSSSSSTPQDDHSRPKKEKDPNQPRTDHDPAVEPNAFEAAPKTPTSAQQQQSHDDHQQQQQEPPSSSSLSPTPQQQQQRKPRPKQRPDMENDYTKSLHWNNPEHLSLQKRPIALPSDVEHITEVEWADDAAPAATHASKYAASATNICSVVTNAEKAPRPKPRRPEPCFCEPDLVKQTPCCVDTSCALFACQEECTNSCPAGPLCGNKRISRREWKKLSVFDAGLKGRGLMVMQHCNRWDYIVEYVGVAVKKKYLDGLFNRYRHERMLYIMALDGDVYIDARHRGGIARYINHSCEPNCAVHRWKVKGISRAGVFALRELQEGEELSFDYQWDHKRGRALTKCHCGAKNCRGTIESPKDCDELEFEITEEMEGNWMDPPLNSKGQVGKEITNRVVKVYFEDSEEYYVADVAQYDDKAGKHLLMYRGDPEEHWTNLSKEKWMLLDEEGQPANAIARKTGSAGSSEQSLIVNAPPGSGLSSTVTSPRSDYSRSSSPIPVPSKFKNYLYIQTPVKDAMVVRHSLFKCGKYCRVHIDTVNVTVPRGDARNNSDDEEDDDDFKEACEKSEDGTVWKLVVTGMEVKKAIDWLEKVAASVYSSLNGIETPTGLSSSTINGTTAAGAVALEKHITTELIIPRVIVDEVKKRYFSLKGYCYNVDVSFSHSDSKSKQFAKMSLAADLGSDMANACEYLYTEMTQMCLQQEAPLTNIGVYKDLGFLGGELSSAEYQLLFESKRTLSKGASTDCCEDLIGSTFAQSFMEANRCSIWVQAEEDMGRVSKNRVINESYANKPRKIFFGVAPGRVPTLWGHLKTRIMDLNRGVQFLHLGSDRIYQHALLQPIKKNGRSGCNYFFDFVQKTSGASVRVDSITGSSHLRIDGGDAGAGGDVFNEKIDVAMELISLQIELLRDHHIRKQRWGFGRDWALLLESDAVKKSNATSPNNVDAGSTASPEFSANASNKPATASSSADSLRLSDPRAVGTSCLEISEIVTGAGLSEKVAAHACIIFYRYINLNLSSLNNASNFKLRDIQLASLFIANKSQKVVKWKRLEAVLEHAYRVFYPGSYFNPASEEAKNWERRVIKAEKTVLTALNYDVFWPGVDWVINAVVGTKAMAEPLAENAMALALSGHVLAAGPVLWLKYGPKYAFAAICGFLSMDISPLFPALSLQPLTVSHAAELIYHSCQALSRVKVGAKAHELFSDTNGGMGMNVQQVQKDCAAYISKHPLMSIDDSKFVSSPAYKEISGRAKLRRVFRGVRAERIEESILPVLGKICFESKCTIRFSDGMLEGTNDIVLEGSWKSLSIAGQLLCEVASLPQPVPYEQSTAANAMLYSALAGPNAPQHDPNLPADSIGKDVIKQVKVQPGLLEMKEIDGKNGWSGTFVDDSFEEEGGSTYDAGWKTCVAANAPQEHLDSAGLRWWVPHRYGPSLSGSLCEIFSSPKLIDHGRVDMRALALLAKSFSGGYSRLQSQYPALASYLTGPDGDETQKNESVAISLQRWPPEKIEMKERSTSGHGSMQMGYSVAALQEMQLLHQLHFLIPSPQGHPNFILPLAIALDSDGGHSNYIGEDDKDSAASLIGTTSGITSNKAAANDILAMIERNQRATGKKRLASKGSHLVLEPTPLNLQKVMSRYQRKNNGGAIIRPSVLASWCHDMLSAISFCHSNHIVLRSLLPDQIHLDHSGTAKLSSLSKVMVLHGKDRTKEFDPLKFIRNIKKERGDHNTEDVEPFAAPELLLGGTRYTKETDMWAFGALLANLLLGKQLFPGKDRVSKMTQVFKIVGVPEKDNYERAKRFPFYSNNMYVIGEEGKKKKYSRGVEKALRVMLNAFGESIDNETFSDLDLEREFAGLISLIDGLLHLDPKRRMTADEALRHQYMMNHVAKVERQDFRGKYVEDWLDLKENVLTKGKPKKSKTKSSFGRFAAAAGIRPEEQQRTGSSPFNGGSRENEELKRKAFLIGASSGVDGGDDLYNLDDLLGSSSKKPKL